eukprot:UN02780
MMMMKIRLNIYGNVVFMVHMVILMYHVMNHVLMNKLLNFHLIHNVKVLLYKEIVIKLLMVLKV